MSEKNLVITLRLVLSTLMHTPLKWQYKKYNKVAGNHQSKCQQVKGFLASYRRLN